MADFPYYSAEDVILANLRECADRADMILEQERAHLRELALQITKDLEATPDFAESLPDLLPAAIESTIRTPEPNTDTLESNGRFARNRQKLMLCMEINSCMRGLLSPDVFFTEPDALPEHTAGRIAYQRSSYADTAYLRFAEFFPDARASYTHSFPAACEEVFNRLCEYCILPLENSSEGQLHTFSRLIDRYGLKIAATTNVLSTDHSKTTTFALLRLHTAPRLLPERKSYFFECALPISASPSPAEFLQAAQLCGLRPCRIDSRPLSEPTPRHVAHYVFQAEDQTLSAFLLYLTMEAPECETVGIYPNLT